MGVEGGAPVGTPGCGNEGFGGLGVGAVLWLGFDRDRRVGAYRVGEGSGSVWKELMRSMKSSFLWSSRRASRRASSSGLEANGAGVGTVWGGSRLMEERS